MLYVTVRWWFEHEHGKPSVEAHIKPNLGERAYLVFAGVLHKWKKADEPFAVNMDHQLVKAYYQGKAAPVPSLPSDVMATPQLLTSLMVQHPAPLVAITSPAVNRDNIRDCGGVSKSYGDGWRKDTYDAAGEEEDSLFVPEMGGKRPGAGSPFLRFIPSPEPSNTTRLAQSGQARESVEKAVVTEKNKATASTRLPTKRPTAKVHGTFQNAESAFVRAVRAKELSQGDESNVM
jgi:hypothetical protein